MILDNLINYVIINFLSIKATIFIFIFFNFIIISSIMSECFHIINYIERLELNMFSIFETELIIRLVLAAVCGIIIGYERKSHAKAAGVRTHAVVACASALMMILSKYAYADVLEMNLYGDLVKIDPSRIASGVVSGVGFLGAGLIFVNKKMVMGLTTAAGIWATCGIGMAIGAGLYVIGVSAAILLLFLQIILHAIPNMSAVERSELHQALSNLEAEILKNEQDSENTGKTIYTITVTTSTEEQDKAITEEITI